MNAIVPFDSQSNLPAYLSQDDNDLLAQINKDVVRAPAFPTMSIKGKVFTMVKDGQRKIVTKPGEEDEVAQSLGVVVLRANMNSKNFYVKGFVEGDMSPPDCHSTDGVAPSIHARNPQAKKCAVCPHNVWGSRVSNDGDRPGEEKKGKACSDQGRLAIAAPDRLEEPMLLRVPPASLKNLREAVKLISGRKIPYNAVILKVSFDPEMASPTLKFKPIGLLPEATYRQGAELYDSDLVRSITGLDDVAPDTPAEAESPVSADELDAAIAARDAAQKAAAAPAPAPAPVAAAPKPAPKAKPKAAPAPAPVVEDDLADLAPPVAAAPAPAPAPAPRAAAPAPAASAGGDLLGDLDALLGGTDD